jgi:hypothetical protein
MMDDELDAAIAALRRYDPASGFADRVMARVAVRQPVAARRRPPLAVAVGAVLAVAGSMLASIVWTWRHQTALVSFGRRAAAQTSAWISDGLPMVAQYPLTQQIIGHVPQVALVLILGSIVYVGGLFALFRLMVGPASPRVAYARN